MAELNVEQVLEEVSRAGVRVSLNARYRIVAAPRDKVTPALLAKLQSAAPEIRRVLSARESRSWRLDRAEQKLRVALANLEQTAATIGESAAVDILTARAAEITAAFLYRSPRQLTRVIRALEQEVDGRLR